MHAKKIVTSNRTVKLRVLFDGQEPLQRTTTNRIDDVTKGHSKHKKCNTIQSFSLTFICESFSNTRILERTVFSSKESGIQLSVKTTKVTKPRWYATAQSLNLGEINSRLYAKSTLQLKTASHNVYILMGPSFQ